MRQMASQSREVCRQYARTGTCRYGDHCRYAHQQYEGPSASGNAYGGPSQPSTSGYSSDRNRGYAQPRYPSQQPHYGSRPQTYGDGRNSTAYDTGGGYRGHNNNSGYNSGYQSQSHHQRYTQPSYGQAPYGRYQQGGGYSSDGRLHLPDLTPDWKDRQWLGCKAAPVDTACEVPVRIMTYNMLADQYAHKHYAELYQGIPPQYLDWDTHRWPLALREITHWDPDVICLQEVDRYEDIRTALEPLGYQGIFAQRSGDRGDGCATFWRASRISLIEHHTVHMHTYNLRDNVALIVALACHSSHTDTHTAIAAEPAGSDCMVTEGEGSINLEPGPSSAVTASPAGRLVIANTHVLFNNKRGDCKVGQIRTALASARHMVERIGLQGASPAVVYTGDFNTAPGSGLYRFLSQGWLDIAQHDRRELSGQNEGYGFNQYLRDLHRGVRTALLGHVPDPHPPPPPVGAIEATTDTLDTSSSDAETAFGNGRNGRNGQTNSTTPTPTGTPAPVQIHDGVGPTAAVGVGVAEAVQGALRQLPGVAVSSTMTTTAETLLQQYQGPLPATVYAPWQQGTATGTGTAPVLVSSTDQVVQQTTTTTVATTAPTEQGSMSVDASDAAAGAADGAGGSPRHPKRPRGVETAAVAQGMAVVGAGGLDGGQVWVDREAYARMSYWGEEELQAALGVDAAKELLAGLRIDPRDLRRVRAQQGQQGLLIAKHPFVLRSAYVAVTGAEPTFTSCHKRCIETLDYIWFTPDGCPPVTPPSDPAQTTTTNPGHGAQAMDTSSGQQQQQQHGNGVTQAGEGAAQGPTGTVMRAQRVLGAPDSTQFTRGMPHRNWASDHICQVADFALRFKS